MWQRVTQHVRNIRRRRIFVLRHSALGAIRQQHKRMIRLLTAPVLLMTVMTFSYLYILSVSIELNQLIESVTQPSIVIANDVHDVDPGTQISVLDTPPVTVLMITATPSPIIPTPVARPTSVIAPSQRISSISIPAIGVDSIVTEVGWENVINSSGESELVWQVARYAVGHHFTSAAPGEMDNIVLSAHVGGYGRVFYRLNELRPDDEILLMSHGRVYTYRVRESIYVNEANVTESEQIANLSYINSTGSEVVTLVTCWPPSGPDKFSQRLIVRAWPTE